MSPAHAQSASMNLPKQVEAGSAFSIQTSGSGKAVLYIVGFNQVVRRDIQLGDAASFCRRGLHNAGHYVVALVGQSGTDNGAFDVTPAAQVGSLSFLAKPSRLPVSLHDGISGAVYVFDAYQNLITRPMPGHFSIVGNLRCRRDANRSGP